MMVSLPADTWLRLIIWLVIGLAIYFFYGLKNSQIQEPTTSTSPVTTTTNS
ncbi:MAG: amino acid permease C-terminal domain-containing protein [Candidatus Thermochlorobacter sp.]